MKVCYLGVIRTKTGEESKELVAEKELTAYSRFSRDRYASFMTVFAKIAADRTRPSERKTIEQQGFLFHTYTRPEGIFGVIITDDGYPAIVAQRLLSEVLDEFLTKHPKSTWNTGSPNLNTELKADTERQMRNYLAQYQDPHQVDGILKIQKELDDTKITLHKTFESALQRGEKLDDLIEKSSELSTQSKLFYKQASKQNSCCTLM